MIGAAATLPAGTRKVEFQYTALSLLAPEKVRFKYRLDGYDADWIDAGGLTRWEPARQEHHGASRVKTDRWM